jgi:hypothetical protein
MLKLGMHEDILHSSISSWHAQEQRISIMGKEIRRYYLSDLP